MSLVSSSRRGREDRMSMVSYASSLASVDELSGSWKSGEQDDRIFVSIRLRPLNEKEKIARIHHVVDWECVSNNTIIFNNHADRSSSPMAYTFNRVFGSECSTTQVYEEGAKEVALSVLNGINASVFAYGQTSSGKTYTMTGITEYAIDDIYDYIEQHQERKFVLKFSAMEIYNEAVRDLLSTDGTPLKLHDDPEKGTIVDKLIEETLEGKSHLLELLAICKAQRQIGETAINENSSRSHQILRITTESSPRENAYDGSLGTLVATVNFVDLAGSERASQSLTAGTRLKEGSHINRSLLTLGTVIRKLSKGRNGHIPYRDSKLTRILQNSLGGNAKTAVICTMSPARSHVEQSKNTLLFASCAKEVSNSAQVNVVMSDKVMVKQLQKELARLEMQLRNLGSIPSADDSVILLREKDLLIQQRDKEIKELKWQRDLAQSRAESLLKKSGINRATGLDEISTSETSETANPWTCFQKSSPRKDVDEANLLNDEILQIPKCQDDNFLLDGSAPKFESDPCHGWEEIDQNNRESGDNCKEDQSMQKKESTFEDKPQANVALTCSEHKEEDTALAHGMNETVISPQQDNNKELKSTETDDTYEILKQKIQELQRTINHLEKLSSSEADTVSSKRVKWTRSSSKRSVLMTIPSTLWYEKEEENDVKETPEAVEAEIPDRPSWADQVLSDFEHVGEADNSCAKESQELPSTDLVEAEMVKEITIDDTNSVVDFATRVNKKGYRQAQNYNPLPETPPRTDESRIGTLRLQTIRQQGHNSWPQKFERYRRKIIELWDICNVPLVHRSYFFLVFKGDPSDNVYMEVELRRLYFIKDAFSHGAKLTIDTNALSPAASYKAIVSERETLVKKLQKKYTKKEREDIFRKWGINVRSKERSLQLARCLWTDTRDMRHIKDSAVLVAKLMNFVQPRHAPKEVFGLTFLFPSASQRRKSSNWGDNMTSL